MERRRVGFVIYEGFQSLDLVGPYEVFQQAGRLTGDYEVVVVAPEAGLVGSRSGLPVHASHGVADVPPNGVDTIVVAGGRGVDQAVGNTALTGWLSATAAHARRVASVCSGAFLLAEVGLLDGRRATTHWGRARELAERHPAVHVDADPIFIRDGRVWTSAGVTAGMDLALALVEDDHGRQVAHEVARQLVMYLRRPGGQAQFSAALSANPPATDPVRAAVAAIHANPGGRHALDDLARHARLSPRHLQRRFTAELGTPPATYVQRVHLEAAQRALAESGDPLDAVAHRCGFGTAETMRRAFHRNLGVAPSDYRERFRSSAVEKDS
ncbi:GlxA family transcriptional regulator [Actinosynnema sp. NPDC023587]|uniref:GlxA family transcriptional regulator n=1 Tax=Actinosynnema sp. NPDC023587 TaxID=3154695 RepID=UPI0034083816